MDIEITRRYLMDIFSSYWIYGYPFWNGYLLGRYRYFIYLL